MTSKQPSTEPPKRPLFPATRAMVRFVFSKRMLYAAAIVGTIGAIVWQIENWRGRTRWERTKSEILATGESLNWQEFVAAPIADEDNAAKHPVFDVIVEPFDGGAKVHGHDYLLKFSNLEEQLIAGLPESASDGRRSGESLTLEGDVLAQTREAGLLIDQMVAAFERPGCQWFPPTHFSESHQFSLPMASNAADFMVLLHSLVMARANAHLDAGDAASARREIDMMLKMSLSMSGADLVESLVHLAHSGIAIEGLEALLVRSEWEPNELEPIQTTLDSADHLAAIDNSFQFGRARSVFFLNALAEGEDWAQRLSDKTFKLDRYGSVLGQLRRNKPQNILMGLGCRYMPKGWHYQNLARGAERWDDELLRHFDRVNRRVLRPGFETTRKSDPPRTPYNFIAELGFVDVSNLYVKAARVESNWKLLAVQCALQRHRYANGSLPKELDALVPAIIPQLPTDPVTGLPPHFSTASDSSATLATLDLDKTGNPALYTCRIPSDS